MHNRTHAPLQLNCPDLIWAWRHAHAHAAALADRVHSVRVVSAAALGDPWTPGVQEDLSASCRQGSQPVTPAQARPQHAEHTRARARPKKPCHPSPEAAAAAAAPDPCVPGPALRCQRCTLRCLTCGQSMLHLSKHTRVTAFALPVCCHTTCNASLAHTPHHYEGTRHQGHTCTGV